jgi:hypothetical protein
LCITQSVAGWRTPFPLLCRVASLKRFKGSLTWRNKVLWRHRYHPCHRTIESGNLEDVDMDNKTTIRAVLVARDPDRGAVKPLKTHPILKILFGAVVLLFLVVLYKH